MHFFLAHVIMLFQHIGGTTLFLWERFNAMVDGFVGVRDGGYPAGDEHEQGSLESY
ncbi:uncharacterized protein Dana_GF27781 [Drosophila ananassae]|uniref:Uncharacterized protein n=1 Tax=Drosophila ananassae TaxID=7217 RepID=A0A0N8P263_DROAN|nr:uncharacterized protein Dana_GF27757 [Drosophila ananassae]KPU81844.1 uncharacterized protein Dana_GF27781 [Drosophila ananassae]